MFHSIAYEYARADWYGLRHHLSDVSWKDIFKLSASAAASEFSMIFAACAAAIVHRNYFFRLYQQNKSPKSKVKFRQASNLYKRFVEAAKLV